jgi:ubiquinone/menaquinone biosynthesis C-methylase UbiE
MGVPFDHIASVTDSMIAKTITGQLQRKCVWSYIESIMPELNGYEMLEINCGAGDDAILFGEKGLNMIATDIGAEMQKITSSKSERFSMINGITSHYLDLEAFDVTLFDKRFDLVFSNFGTLNATSPESLRILLRKLPLLLNPGGRFIGVVMPRFCAWESCYFLVRFDFKKVFRRFSWRRKETDDINFDIKTWFYNPAELKKWSKEKFKLIKVKPVGITLPPAHINNFFGFKKKFLVNLGKIEQRIASVSFLANVSDHFVIDLQLK